MNEKVALITGAAKRVGALTATTLHAAGFNVVIHYRGSKQAATDLISELNYKRLDSAIAVQADLNDIESLENLVKESIAHWGRLDVLVNNAANFYPTPLADATLKDWDDLFNTNTKAPFFLTQLVADELKKQHGSVVNMVDIHAEHPLKNYNLYGMAKAALAFMTKSLAKDLAPEIRVNGIAPGMVMWADEQLNAPKVQEGILKRIPLKRAGTPEDIAAAILFLVQQPYITGQILAIDGGRSLMV